MRSKSGSFLFGLNKAHTLHHYNLVGMQLGNMASFTSGIVLMAGRNPRDFLDKGKRKVEEEQPQPRSLYEGSEEKQNEQIFGSPVQYDPTKDFRGWLKKSQ